MDDVAARMLGRVAANGIELAYETFGEAGAPPAVLIMGLATQMIAWPDELCEGLARRVCGGPGRRQIYPERGLVAAPPPARFPEAGRVRTDGLKRRGMA
jgi:hypothetical protein